MVFTLGNYMVIEGFEEGILYMKKGGKATLLIPSYLAYGTSGTYWGIPGYSPIIFEVELLEVFHTATKK